MGVRRRHDEIGRQNVLYVIEACSRRIKSVRGGQAYLARLLVTTTTQHLSDIRHGKRNVGRDIKTRIEGLFKLADGWMDSEHGPEAVDFLLPRVPSVPHPQSKGTQKTSRSATLELLESRLAELQQRLDELESHQVRGSSTRK